MLIRLFRSAFSYQLILLLIISLLLWLPAFIHPYPMPRGFSVFPLYESIKSSLSGFPRLTALLAYFLVFTQSIVLNFILESKGLIPKNSAFPALVYLLFVSWQPLTLTLSPALLSLTFLIAFLYFFLKVYERTDAFREVFSASFCLAMAGAFNFPVLSLIFAIWIGFFLFRVLAWREWIISLIGILAPFLILLFYYFWYDHTGLVCQNLIRMFRFPLLSLQMNVLYLIAWGALLLFLLAGLWKVLTIIPERVISFRKNFLFIIWLFFLSLPMIALAGTELQFQSLIPLLPASIIISYFFSLLKKLLLWEILFSVFIVTIILIRII